MKYLDIPEVNGVLIVTHVKTGRFYLVCSINVHDSAITVVGQCRLGTYQSPALQELYNDDPELDFDYLAFDTREASRVYRQSEQAKYFGTNQCLNAMDYPVLPGTWRIVHSPTGNTIVGKTLDLIKQCRVQYNQLKTNTHKTVAFQELYNSDPSPDNFKFSFIVIGTDDNVDVLYNNWVKEAVAQGKYMTSRKGKENESTNSVGKTSGMYILSFPKYGLFYVGSSTKVKARLAQHKSFLKHGKNTCRLVQEAYNLDPHYTVAIHYTDTVEDAIKHEQDYVALHQGNPLCLNLATDVSAPCRNLHDNPEWHRKIVEATAKVKRTPESRANYGEKMKAWHEANKGHRDGANNPFAKSITMFNVTYGSVMDAVRTGILPASVIRKRLKDPNDLEIVYCE